MTIFLDNLKESLIHHLEIIKARIDQDEKSFSGILRNKELSDAKKELANQLMAFIRQLDTKEDDKLIKDVVVKEILKMQMISSQMCEKFGQKPGKFDIELNNLLILSEKAYLKFYECGLLGVSRNSDPFNILCFYLGHYLCSKLEQSLEFSYISYVTTHPNVSDLWRLGLKKEKIIAEQIKKCKSALDVLNKEHADFLEHYHARVIDFIDSIVKLNEVACAEHGATIVIPLVRFNLFSMLSASSSLHPKLGSLNDHMNRAREEVLKLSPKKTAETESKKRATSQ